MPTRKDETIDEFQRFVWRVAKFWFDKKIDDPFDELRQWNDLGAEACRLARNEDVNKNMPIVTVMSGGVTEVIRGDVILLNFDNEGQCPYCYIEIKDEICPACGVDWSKAEDSNQVIKIVEWLRNK